jgi:hypothetical protein
MRDRLRTVPRAENFDNSRSGDRRDRLNKHPPLLALSSPNERRGRWHKSLANYEQSAAWATGRSSELMVFHLRATECHVSLVKKFPRLARGRIGNFLDRVEPQRLSSADLDGS